MTDRSVRALTLALLATSALASPAFAQVPAPADATPATPTTQSPAPGTNATDVTSPPEPVKQALGPVLDSYPRAPATFSQR